MMEKKITVTPEQAREYELLSAVLAIPQVYGVGTAKRVRGALKSAIEWAEAGSPMRLEDRETLMKEIAEVLSLDQASN